MKSSLPLLMSSLWPVYCQNMSIRSPRSENDIGCTPEDLSAYNGTASTTETGHTCQMWSVNTPHAHKYNHVGEHNYCRRPNTFTSVWCYTTDPDTRWAYCKVPKCGTKGKKHLLPESFCPLLLFVKKKLRVASPWTGHRLDIDWIDV